MGNDNLKRILDEVRGRFPFDNYANETSTHIYLAGLVQEKLRLKQGMRITDIGAGPSIRLHCFPKWVINVRHETISWIPGTCRMIADRKSESLQRK
jgi:hypothetical protein